MSNYSILQVSTMPDGEAFTNARGGPMNFEEVRDLLMSDFKETYHDVSLHEDFNIETLERSFVLKITTPEGVKVVRSLTKRISNESN